MFISQKNSEWLVYHTLGHCSKSFKILLRVFKLPLLKMAWAFSRDVSTARWEPPRDRPFKPFKICYLNYISLNGFPFKERASRKIDHFDTSIEFH